MSKWYSKELPRLKVVDEFELLFDAMANLSAAYSDLEGQAMDIFEMYERGDSVIEIQSAWVALQNKYEELSAQGSVLGPLITQKRETILRPLTDECFERAELHLLSFRQGLEKS